VTTYYKATRPDGKDFATGTIDYGAGARSCRHPAAKKIKKGRTWQTA
jgi:hypothetical protein